MSSSVSHREAGSSLPALAARGGVGGVLMGLANLVPGISGGTMLLAVGVYPRFIRAVAEVTTFRFRARSVVLLVCVVAAAIVTIAALAGTVRDLVVDHRWITYSLFIGLTLGGVPLLWRMLRPISPVAAAWAAVGIAGMVVLALVEPAAGSASGNTLARMAMLVVAGAAGGAAMILPGISGAYLLLVLGQYEVILGSIDSARDAIATHDWSQLMAELRIFVPVGAGIVIGVVGVSNLVKLALDRFPRATLGLLLGLLLGAVAGLWPFRAPVGQASGPADLAPQVAYFRPTAVQGAGAVGLVCAGFLVSWLVCRLGGADREGSGQNGPAA